VIKEAALADIELNRVFEPGKAFPRPVRPPFVSLDTGYLKSAIRLPFSYELKENVGRNER
jgi:hypothetical protein